MASRSIAIRSFAALGSLPWTMRPTTPQQDGDPRFTHVILSDSLYDSDGASRTEALQAAIRQLSVSAASGSTALVLSPRRGRQRLNDEPQRNADNKAKQWRLGDNPDIKCAKVALRATNGSASIEQLAPKGTKGHASSDAECMTLCSGSYTALHSLDTGQKTLTVTTVVDDDEISDGNERPMLTGKRKTVHVRYNQLLLLPSVAPAAALPGGGLIHNSAFTQLGSPGANQHSGSSSVSVISGAKAAQVVRDALIRSYSPVAIGNSSVPSVGCQPASGGADQSVNVPLHITVIGSGWTALEAAAAVLGKTAPLTQSTSSSAADGATARPAGSATAATTAVTLVSKHPVPLADDVPRYLGEVLARRLQASAKARTDGGRESGSSRRKAAALSEPYSPDGGSIAAGSIDFRPFTLVQYAHGEAMYNNNSSSSQQASPDGISGRSAQPGAASTAVPDALSAAIINSNSTADGSKSEPSPPPNPNGEAMTGLLARTYASQLSAAPTKAAAADDAALQAVAAALSQTQPTLCRPQLALQPLLTLYTAASYDAMLTSRLSSHAILLAPKGGLLGGGASASGSAAGSTPGHPWPLQWGVRTSIRWLCEGAGTSGGGRQAAARRRSDSGSSGGRASASAHSSSSGNGIEIDAHNGGIAVSAELSASCEGVWAAGDGISWPDPLLGRSRLAPSSPSLSSPPLQSADENVLDVISYAQQHASAAADDATVNTLSAAASHAAASAAVAVRNMCAAESVAEAAVAAAAPVKGRSSASSVRPASCVLERYSHLPVTPHALPPPLSLRAVTVGHCDPALQASHGYFWHTAPSGARAAALTSSSASTPVTSVGAVITSRDKTGVGSGVVFFTAPVPITTASPSDSASHGASDQHHDVGFRVTGALLWDSRKQHFMSNPIAASSSQSNSGKASEGQATGLPRPLDADPSSAGTSKATALIHRLMTATRSQPLRGSGDEVAQALDAAARAVLAAAMPLDLPSSASEVSAARSSVHQPMPPLQLPTTKAAALGTSLAELSQPHDCSGGGGSDDVAPAPKGQTLASQAPPAPPVPVLHLVHIATSPSGSSGGGMAPYRTSSAQASSAAARGFSKAGF